MREDSRGRVVGPRSNPYRPEWQLSLPAETPRAAGTYLQKKGDLARARKCARRVSAIRLGSRGADLERVGLLTHARQALEQSLAIWPNDSIVQACLAHVLERQALGEGAKIHYRKAFETLPECLGENPGFPSEIRNLLYSPSLFTVGIQCLNTVVIRNPKDAEAYYARGQLRYYAGQSKEAVADLQRAVALNPRLFAAWNALAALARQGLMSPQMAQRIDLKLIDLNAERDYAFESSIDLTDVRDLGTAYRKITTQLRSLPILDVGPLFPLHSPGTTVSPDIVPVFDRFRKSGRLPGSYFQLTSDIREIASLYHPTSFPFE